MPGSRFYFKKGGPIMSTCDKCTLSDCYVGNPCCDPVTSPCTFNECFPTQTPAPVPAPGPGCSPGDCFPGNPCCDPVTSPCTDSECFPPAPVPAPVPAPMGMGDHGSG